MAKLKAVLDQETWVEVDVPDEFQSIVASLVSTGHLTTANSDEGASYNGEAIPSNNDSHTQQKTEETDSLGIYETNKSEKVSSLTSAAQNNHVNMKERGKSTSQTLVYRGVGYHMVNWLVILCYIIIS